MGCIELVDIQDIPKKVGSFGNGTPNQWGPIKNVPV